MNPWPLAVGELRRNPGGALAVVVLIALAVALGVAIVAQERALREAANRAADRFDLVVGAPGSPTQLVLTTVYLQPAPLELLPAAAWRQVAAMPGVAHIAPVAVTDSFAGYAVVGTEAYFLAATGTSEGRLFSQPAEAVVGADVHLAIGATLRPQHGTPAENILEQHEHDASLTVVGRLTRAGTPWDRAIVVPMSAIASMHDQHAGLAAGDVASPTTDASSAPPSVRVPALVVKPASVADAYRLRRELREQGLLAVFPAEVLLPLYRLLGDVRDLFAWTAMAYELLVIAAVLLAIVAVLAARRQSLGVLRALGAPRAFLFLTVWLQVVTLIGAGIVIGALLGALACRGIAAFASARTGLAVELALGWSEATMLLSLLAVASLIAALPSLLALRMSAARLLRAA